MSSWHSFISLFGLLAMMGIAWLISENRKKALAWRIILGGLTIQFILAFLILKTGPGHQFFELAKNCVNQIIALSDEGARFLFGSKFEDHFFAFKVLPTIVFISSLSSVLFYFGVLQKIINVMAWVMYKIMGISGSESLVTAANVFIGQTEAPMLVKPYINTMTRSEIATMMCSGMATVAGGVLAAYVGMGISAGHLLAASIMSAPAAIVIAKIIVPETETSPTIGKVSLDLEIEDVNVFDAACRGASDGLKLALNVAAMLIAFISLVALANFLLGTVTGYFGYKVTVELILGYAFSPLAFLMGIPWEDCLKIGQLLGEKMVVNEFLAYIHLGELIKEGAVSQRAAEITTYALCGFANFSSVAIQIGGIGSIAPERKNDFARLGIKAMIGGTLAAFMTACIAGFLL